MQLRPYQHNAIASVLEAMEHDLNVLLQAPTGAGKCLGKGTPVLMFDGTIKPVEDVYVGDLLMGPDSEPRTVQSVTSGEEELFKVIPTKGAGYIVNRSHILSLRITGKDRVGGFAPGEIVNVSVDEYLTKGKTFKHCAKGWRTGVDFEGNNIDSIITPYILGLWLGDGANVHVNSFANPDHEVIEELNRYAKSLGMHIRSEYKKEKCPIHLITDGIKKKANPFTDEIRRLGIAGNKHIPHEFKTAPTAARLDLLAGLMDSDGSLSNGGYDYITKDHQLAEDIAFVARSLGLAAYISYTWKKAQGWKEKKRYSRVYISGECSLIPCRIVRKKAKERKQRKNVLRVGIKVQPIGIGSYYGFEISGNDRLFLLGDFTVTHNTIMFSDLIKRLNKMAPGCRVLLLAHRQELVAQAQDKLLQVWPECHGVSIACAGKEKQVSVDGNIVIASIQTLARRIDDLEPFNLCIVDEAHRLPDQTARHTQYIKVLEALRLQNHAMRLLGVTATPYRLGHGYIYGDQCREGRVNLFGELHHQISVKDLVAEEYLAPMRGKVAVSSGLYGELRSVKVNGDYAEGEAGKVMSKPLYINSVVESYQKYGVERKHVMVFACTISHAEKLKTALGAAGYSAEVVHSKTQKAKRQQILDRFVQGDIHFLVNVNVLIEGFDAPLTDCIIMARPTLSPALYLQQAGRGLRIAPGKKDCLLIDLVGNTVQFGADFDNIRVKVPRPSEDGTDAPGKPCPECAELVHASKMECPECGYIWMVEEVEAKKPSKMHDIQFNQDAEPVAAKIVSASLAPYTSRQGNEMLRLELKTDAMLDTIYHYVNFDDEAHWFQRQKSKTWWKQIHGWDDEPPENNAAAEFLFRYDLINGMEVKIVQDGKFTKIAGW